jgi:hypothetical protein
MAGEKTGRAEGVKIGVFRLTFLFIRIKIETTDRRDSPCFAMEFFLQNTSILNAGVFCMRAMALHIHDSSF